MKQIDKLELLKYEAPLITEFISWDWLQNIVARLLAIKVNYKIKRYNKRIKREQFINHFKTH